MATETTPDVLTPVELAERWRLYHRTKGTPNTGRIAYLIERGELPNAFRLRLTGGGTGAREWRIPLADVLDFERRQRAAPPAAAAGPPTARPAAPRPSATGSDGKSRLAKGRR